MGELFIIPHLGKSQTLIRPYLLNFFLSHTQVPAPEMENGKEFGAVSTHQRCTVIKSSWAPRPHAVVCEGFNLLLLSLLLNKAVIWGFPWPRGQPSHGLLDMRSEFKISLRLARKLLSEIRGIAHLFADTHLVGVSLDFLPQREQLPNVTMTFKTWIQLSDPDRLSSLSRLLGHFQAPLGEIEGHQGWKGSLRKRLWIAQLDLRDLQSHLHFQMKATGYSPPEDKETRGLEERALGRLSLAVHQVSWPQLLSTYQVLRSLELVLARAVRDYLLLSKGMVHAQSSAT
ncbi:interleukin-27 subunit alpha [Dromiciops gliroides]|uniref:interleukin-27 subunit alpha n=1 Tax=Dromiciops gliroides TaxID=33562 RepID=UPI001CC70D2A|nr:interleukin-27 subunit alpha [Dromiciops gliroides]